MNNPEQAFGLHGRMNPVLQTALFLLLLLSPLAGLAQNGNGMYDAIPMGLPLTGNGYYSEYRNNSYYNGTYYYNNFNYNYSPNAQPSSDVWYTFTAGTSVDIDLYACGSGFDTYVHLLDDYGNVVAYTGGPMGCNLMYADLPSGIYYIVVEGSSTTYGDYYLALYTYGIVPPAPSPGANMGNAINAGTLVQGVPFSDTRSNSDPLLGNDIGHASYDIYYSFTLTGTSEVALSHCGSAIDTYMHLLSSSGAAIATNDDGGPLCPGSSQASIVRQLSAGTYYVVSEGYGNYSGSITTTISLVPPPVQLPNISYSSPATLHVGTAASLVPTNTGGPVQTGGGGTVSTFAGSTTAGFVNGTGTAARFSQPAGGVFDSQGNLYVPDLLNERIRKITPAGVVSTFAGSGVRGSANGTGTSASFSTPYRLARDGAGNIYVSDRGSDKIRKITPSGVVSTLAGSGVRGFANGTGSSAAFFAPSGIAVDGSGNVYVADQGNHRIRKITPSGVVTTLAGSGSQGSTNGTGSSASFSYPVGMSMDASGNLYVADYSSQKIRKVTLSGVVSTFAGSGTGGFADGPAASARFNNPLITAVDAQGNVYVTDMNQKIRRISGGIVSTVAGTGSAGSTDGPYLSASFRTPHGMMFDAQGILFVADTENNKIRKLSPASPYSISPALPSELSFNTSTGVISGTPTSVSAAQNYTVTASNSAGSSTTTISITVLAAPPMPSQDRNYILTYSPRKPFTDAASLPFRSAWEVQQTVQYFDGLGRPLQTVQTKGSPGAVKDIVQPVAYDAFGRESRKYLPYATDAGGNSSYKMDALTAGAGVLAFYNPAGSSGTQLPSGHARITKPYGETVFEPSPLNRVLEQGAPGETWQPAATRGSTGRTVVMEYGTNNVTAFTDLADTRMVALYGAALSPTGVPTLTLNGSYAANQLYLTITKDENWTAADGRNGTVEEYKDKQGRVVLKRTFNKKGSVNEMLSTYYVYDDFGNLSFVLPPGIEPDKTILPTAAELDNFAYRYRYDGRKRMVEKKLPGKGAEYIVYNKLDQPILTQDSLQRTTGSWLFSKYDAFGRPVMSGKATLVGTRKQIQDAAEAPGILWETADNSNVVTGYLNTTRTYPLAVNIDHYLTVSYYDAYGFPGAAAVAPQNPYSAMTKGLPTGSRVYTADGSDSYLSASYYDDKGRVTETVSQNHIDGTDRVINTYNFPGELQTSTRTHTGHGQTTVIGTEYSYDHMGRRLRTEQYIDDPNLVIVLSELTYNEIGQLKEKMIHSENDGDTFLNTESYAYNPRGWLKSQSGPNFSQQLKYEDGTSPQYNGNISNQYWGTASNPTLHNYSYLYDRLNRLTSGISDDGFNETIDYDKMGNITGLTRNPMGSSSYAYSGNRLTGISGAVTSSYGYDANGNQTSDSGKGITLAYNYLNLPRTISKASTSETMTNSWLATGAKISKTASGTTRDYAGGIEYSDGAIDFVQTEEGRAIPIGNGYSYEYMLKDHLGNTRVLLKEDGSVLETSDYYPFGLQVSRSGQTVPSPENRYKYNGKELQTELGLGQYDYGARFYDPVVGRWNVVDPLAEKYLNLSPYTYVANNPANAYDGDGRKIIYVNGYFSRLLNLAGIAPGASKEAYWNFFNSSFISSSRQFMGATSNELNEFVDGSSLIGGDQSGADRYLLGMQYAKESYSDLLKGMKKGESFKFVSHSEGGAFAAGMAAFLISQGQTVESMLYLSPDEADEFSSPLGTFSMQSHFQNDPVSPPMRLDGVDVYMNFSSLNGNKIGKQGAHGATVTKSNINKMKNALEKLGPYASKLLIKDQWTITETENGYIFKRKNEEEDNRF